MQAEEANKELLELLVDYLPKTYPDRFVHTESNEFINLATGDVFNLSDKTLDPLEVSALLVQVSASPYSSPIQNLPWHCSCWLVQEQCYI